MPTPRKDSAASVPTAAGTARLANTITVEARFGSSSPEQDPPPAGAQRAGRQHELPVHQRQRLAAHHPGDRGPAEDGDHRHHHQHPGHRVRHQRGQRDHEHQAGKGEHHVHEPAERAESVTSRRHSRPAGRPAAPISTAAAVATMPTSSEVRSAVQRDREQVPAGQRFHPEPVRRADPAERAARGIAAGIVEQVQVIGVGVLPLEPHQQRRAGSRPRSAPAPPARRPDPSAGHAAGPSRATIGHRRALAGSDRLSGSASAVLAAPSSTIRTSPSPDRRPARCKLY